MSNCEKCKLNVNCNNPIDGRSVGSGKKYKIVVIAEFPNVIDCQKNKSFTEERGKLVDGTIRQACEDCEVWYTYLVKCRVSSSEELLPEYIETCLGQQYLMREIVNFKPQIIIALGNNVMKALTGKSGISNHRGSELAWNDIPVVPTYSPTAVMKNPKFMTMFKGDITKAVLLTQGKSRTIDHKYTPIMSKKTLKDVIQRLKNDVDGHKIDHVSLDFETSTFDYWRPETVILTMGICADGYNIYSIPVDHNRSPFKGQFKTIMKLFSFILCSNIPVVNNNWKYDQKWCKSKSGYKISYHDDNMLLSYINDENSPHSEDYQADLYFNAGNYSKEIHWPSKYDPQTHDIVEKAEQYKDMDLPSLMKYNALDALYAWHILSVEKSRMDERSQKIYEKLLVPASHMFTEIELQGMWIDREKLNNARSICDKSISEYVNKLNAMLPEGWINENSSKQQQKDGFNWNSTKQLGELFFSKSGFNFPVKKKTPKGNPSTDEATIINLAAEIEHPALDALLEYRKWSKYESTYLRPWTSKLDKNSRLHPNFKLHGTVTGRLSGEDGIHQVPRDKFIRGLIGAPVGWTFFEIDGSQIELRVAAAIANEKNMLKIFATGGDIHRMTAASVAGKSPEDVTSDERKKAKAVNFGFLYGMGWKKFKIYAWEKYGVRYSDEAAQSARKRFFEMYPDLLTWHARMRKIVKALGYVSSPIGRKRRLPDIRSSEENIKAMAEREAINSPVQGFASDYVLAAMIEVFEHINSCDPEGNTIHIIGMVHDAQYYEIRNDKLMYWASIIKEIFDDTSRLEKWFDYKCPLPITGDIKVGTHWGDAKDWEIGQPLPFEMR